MNKYSYKDSMQFLSSRSCLHFFNPLVNLVAREKYVQQTYRDDM